MKKLRFGDLPLLVRFAVGVAFFTSWEVFEETIVDRYGLWRFMPRCRVGDPCLWDLGAALVICVGLVAASSCRMRCCEQVSP
jgi:hypothetical protein